MRYVPTVDGMLVVDLPGEKLRATCKQVLSDDEVIVELTAMPMAKSHQYRHGQQVHVRRTQTPLQEIWQSIEHPPIVPKVVPLVPLSEPEPPQENEPRKKRKRK